MKIQVTRCDWPLCKDVEACLPAAFIVAGIVIAVFDLCPTHREHMRGLMVGAEIGPGLLELIRAKDDIDWLASPSLAISVGNQHGEALFTRPALSKRLLGDFIDDARKRSTKDAAADHPRP